jgi:hypothetical protein
MRVTLNWMYNILSTSTVLQANWNGFMFDRIDNGQMDLFKNVNGHNWTIRETCLWMMLIPSS